LGGRNWEIAQSEEIVNETPNSTNKQTQWFVLAMLETCVRGLKFEANSKQKAIP
jgi:hypothetical protein